MEPGRPRGQPKTGGRKKGVPNKTTRQVKESLQEVFDRLGGADGLMSWAESEPTEFYKMWVKLLPIQAAEHVPDNKPIEVVIKRAERKPVDGDD